LVHTCPTGAEVVDVVVGGGAALVLVGGGAALVLVGGGAGVVVVGEGLGDGLHVCLRGLQPGEAACASCATAVNASASDATTPARGKATR
jgi:hypothetical protein